VGEVGATMGKARATVGNGVSTGGGDTFGGNFVRGPGAIGRTGSKYWERPCRGGGDAGVCCVTVAVDPAAAVAARGGTVVALTGGDGTTVERAEAVGVGVGVGVEDTMAVSEGDAAAAGATDGDTDGDSLGEGEGVGVGFFFALDFL
jgi:hypothetical protein